MICSAINKDKISYEEFVEIVKAMRHLQKRSKYIRTKEIKEKLEASEAEVDKAINLLLDRQMKLF